MEPIDFSHLAAKALSRKNPSKTLHKKYQKDALYGDNVLDSLLLNKLRFIEDITPHLLTQIKSRLCCNKFLAKTSKYLRSMFNEEMQKEWDSNLSVKTRATMVEKAICDAYDAGNLEAINEILNILVWYGMYEQTVLNMEMKKELKRIRKHS